MKHLVLLPGLISLFPSGAQGYESFSAPVLATGSIEQAGNIAGVPVGIDWNGATSPPTVRGIWRQVGTVTPGVFRRTGSVAEVAVSAAEFIDLHTEWFRVSSRNFELLVSEQPRSTGWDVDSNQFHRGAKVLGSYIDIMTTTDGGLLHVFALLFPEALLEGLSTDTAVSSERAQEIALSSQDGLVLLTAPRKVVAFRGTTPFMAWLLEVGDIHAGFWSYLIDGTTGEILAVGDGVDTDGPSESRPFVRGDANGDKAVNITDSVSILSGLFAGAELSCSDAADLNDDGLLEITDGIYGLNYLFLGGPAPAKPFPNPGPDITRDSFVCPVER